MGIDYTITVYRRMHIKNQIFSALNEYIIYTEHCSVGPTKLIETTIASTTTTARMKISDDEDCADENFG